jgi:hypothetical protein
MEAPMTVELIGGGQPDAIGLVAVSSMRGVWHTTPGGRSEGEGSSILWRAWSTLSLTQPKACLGYAYNGHTALIARCRGRVMAVVGFNPASYLNTAVQQNMHGVWTMLTGSRPQAFTVPGQWYNDLAMIQDPTAISLELPTTEHRALEFADYITGLVGSNEVNEQAFQYTFMPADVETGDKPFVAQCTTLGAIVLCSFLFSWGKADSNERFIAVAKKLIALANSENPAERNLMQGKMMQFIEANRTA